MKIKCNIKYLILLIIIITSCSKNQEDNLKTKVSNRIIFSVKDIKTRAGNENATQLEKSTHGFGVYCVKGAYPLEPSGNLFENHQIKWNGSAWYDQTELEGGEPMFYHYNSFNMHFYYPYRQISDPTNLPISVLQDQSNEEHIEYSDFLVSHRYVSESDNPINVTFKHALTKQIFHFPDLDGTIVAASIKSKIIGVYDLHRKELKSISSTTQKIKPYIHNNNSIEIIQLPQSYNSRHELLTVTIEKGEIRTDHIFLLNEDFTFRDEKLYNFNLSIDTEDPNKDKHILPAPTSVLPWNEETAGDFVAEEIDGGINIINVSDFTDSLSSNGHLGGYYGYVVTPTKYVFTDSHISYDIRNKQGESVKTRGGYATQGLNYDFLKVDGNGELCDIKFSTYNEVSGERSYVDTLYIGNEIFVFSPKEVFVPNVVKVTVASNSASKQLIFTTDKPAPMDLIYALFQWGDGDLERINEITVTIPEGQSSHSIDISTYDKSSNAIVTYDGEKKYNCVNYLKDGNFIVLDGSFWGSWTYLMIPINN